jgi:hypothetical protein
MNPLGHELVTHELELYKQGMSALMLLVPFTQQAAGGS